MNNINTKFIEQLPKSKMSFDQEPSEVAIRLASRLLRTNPSKCRRALSVSLWHSEPSTPSHSGEQSFAGFNVALFCVPVLLKGKRCLTT